MQCGRHCECGGHQRGDGSGVKSNERLFFLDAYRAFFLLFMVEGHVLRAVLDTQLRNETWYVVHEVVHNLTGPGFLFAAGFSFVIPILRSWEDALRFGPASRKRIRKVMTIILIGYLLHLPYLSLSKVVNEATADQLQKFASFNILQCIGISLLILQLVVPLAQTPKNLFRIATVLTLAATLSTPLVWGYRFGDSVPLTIATMFSMEFGSPFPLFPFAGFLFAGTAVALLFMPTPKEGRAACMRWIMWTGIAFIGGGFLFEALPVSVYPVVDFWYTGPTYFFIRLGLLMAAMSLTYAIDRALFTKGRHHDALARWTSATGSETLIVYVLHLVLLFGWVLNPEFHISTSVASSSGVAASFSYAGALIALMVFVAKGWNFLRTRHPQMHQAITGVGTIVFAYYFITNPY